MGFVAHLREEILRKSWRFHGFYGEIREDVGDILDINGRRGIYWRYNGKLVQQTV
jgi:hypothetical protein